MPEYILEVQELLMEQASRKPLSLGLRRGDSVLLRGDAPALFFDILQGIERPHAGSVLFHGLSWNEMTPFAGCHYRGLLARSFAKADLWVQNLSLRQNIELRSLHHSLQHPVDLERDIEALAKELDLTGALDMRPEALSREELAVAQFLRLFCEKTEIILLDNPPDFIEGQFLPVLNKWLNTFVSSGGVVIMATAQEKSEANSSFLSSPTVSGYILDGEVWMDELKR